MNIELNPDSKPIKHIPYCLNLWVKEKEKKEIDRMLVDDLIFPIDEAEWINRILIKSKKGIEDIWIGVDYQSLSFACIHDPFSTPFSDKVLNQVAGNEDYSFIDGFSGYHQVIIVEEEKWKNTFTTDWGSFSYNVIPFGLNISLAVFSPIVIATFHDFIHNFLEVYLDDWIVYHLIKDHIGLLWLMLDCCHQL